MLGLMQPQGLMISSILTHAARHHGSGEIVSRTHENTTHRYTWRDVEARSRRLVRVLQNLGVGPGDRVGTLAWNGFRHLEVYYAAPGMQAICHTINPRLHPDDISYIINHAQDKILFVDSSFAALITTIAPNIAETVKTVVMLTAPETMADVTLAPGMTLACYDQLMDAADDDYVWPLFDENTASALCYTSGTTGRPKGVLYSHRSTWLHAYATALPDVLNIRATSRALPVVPMFHVNAWGMPYAAALVGASLILPGRHLDGASMANLLNTERVTFTAGVPTVWLGLLQHLRSSGERLDTVERIMTGGSAAPPLLIEAFRDEYGVAVEHGWGMSELSPVGTYNAPKPAQQGLTKDQATRHMLKQGRILPGIDMKIVDGDGHELPWDGTAFGDLAVKGPWIASAYYGDQPGTALDQDGWFATGDVATIDPDGFMEITDRSKDVIKSGGEWISSITLENIAVSHPDVLEAAVIAARHPKWDERPLLLVVPRPDKTVDPASVLALYEGKVAKWWLPDEVVVVPELPHTATGKLLKTSLRTQYKDHYLKAS
ncbi:long-chain-fatty-acid--CoA ligase [Acidisphaera sp. S103]|uniref:long-chain-fatty-acid--CoA ligase n=1 Tax=Acidisphaera sp. S103 TaxID=1747223 RepID=UPI001C20B94C